jgi:hypothetical protein
MIDFAAKNKEKVIAKVTTLIANPHINFDDIVAEMGLENRVPTLLSVLGPQAHGKKEGHTSEDGKVHAVLGASSSDRWMKCPGSVRMSKGMPNRSSRFAQEGTCAHHLAELALSSDVHPHWFIGQFIDIKGNLTDDYPDEEEDDVIVFEIDEDMADAVAKYTLEIARITEELYATYDKDDVHIFLEKGFDLSRLYPGMFGTNDYCFFVRGEILIVLDYKHGRGKVVEAKFNPQLLYYALGAILEICRDRGDLPKIVRTVIVQPRAAHRDGPIRTWDYTIDEVMDFTKTLIEAAIATEDPDAPLVPGEVQCFFCNGKAKPCPALFDQAQSLALQDFTDLGDEEFVIQKGVKQVLSEAGENLSKKMVASVIGDRQRMLTILRLAPVLDAMIRDVQAYAQHEAENGYAIEGQKIVRKRSNRKLKNEADTIKRLRNMGIPDKDIFKEPKCKTPAQLEKIPEIGKDLVAQLSFHPEGKLTLVPITDARPAIEINPFSDLGDEELGIIDADFSVVDDGEPLLLAAPDADEWDIL